MHSPILVGVLAAAAAMAMSLAFFFARAWRYRPEEREYAYFALLCVALASYFCGLDALNLLAIGVSLPFSRTAVLEAITVPVSFAVAFQLHFALRYGRVSESGWIMAPLYLLAAAFALLGLTDGWWTGPVGEPAKVSRFGLELHVLELEHTRASLPFFVEALLVAVATVVLIARRWRKQGGAALIGSVVALLAVVNDVSLAGFGSEPLVPLMPFGLLALGYGVAMTLVGRYGRVSNELERSTMAVTERSRQLEASYRELKRTQQELVRSKQLAVVGELSAVIAHEVRNPLAIVNNAVASLRKRHTRGDERRILLNIINEEMGRLDHLVTRMLDYARPLVPAREPVDLAELVRHGLDIAEDVEVRVRGSAEVVGDVHLLRRAFQNLVENAAQARARRIDIAFESGAEITAIHVRDDGQGMSRAERERAMSPFFTTRPTGTGLGLPVVARIAAAHGGEIFVASEERSGTTVTLRLPTRGPKPTPRPRMDRISVLP